jgi:HSP20 family protein
MPSSQGQGGEGGMLMPHMDVSETDKELKVCAELPGVSEKDVDVRLEDDVLVIRAEKKFERKDEKENFHFMERSYGTFQRSLRLPFSVNPDDVKAGFENGVLTVTLPKSAQQARSRRIEVSRGPGGAKQIEQAPADAAKLGEQGRTEGRQPSGKG